MIRYPSSLVFGVLVLVYAFAVSAQTKAVPVGSTLTIDVGVPIKGLVIDGKNRGVEVKRLNERVLTVTFVRAGPTPISVKTATGTRTLEVNVLGPPKQELPSSVLEDFLVEHAAR